MFNNTDRLQDRHTLSIHMEVYRAKNDKEPLFKCRTRNIGFGGVMIRNRGFKLRKGATLKLLLKSSGRSIRKQFPVNAKIVWKTSAAIGLKFSPSKDTEMRAFKRFLFEAKVATHARARQRWHESQLTATVVSACAV